MERWDQLNTFFNHTGVKLTFGLNALFGRNESRTEKGVWIGDWQPQNTRDFVKYTISKGYKVDSYEFGNQLCGSGIGARVDANQYGKDVIVLKNLVKELYADPETRPKVLGPDCFYDEKWLNTFLEVSGRGVVDGVTHHIYNLGPGDDPNLMSKILDPLYLSQVSQTYKGVLNVVNKFRPQSGAWVSESGGAFNNGSKDVSPTFVDGFWYLDQMGMAATYDQKVFCRQALIGGNYGLLMHFYGTELWGVLCLPLLKAPINVKGSRSVPIVYKRKAKSMVGGQSSCLQPVQIVSGFQPPVQNVTTRPGCSDLLSDHTIHNSSARSVSDDVASKAASDATSSISGSDHDVDALSQKQVVSLHPMVTHSKTGSLKPKVFLTEKIDFALEAKDLCYKTGLPLPACLIRLKILELLPGVDIARMECVCSEMRYLASNNDLWKQKFAQEFGRYVGSIRNGELEKDVPVMLGEYEETESVATISSSTWVPRAAKFRTSL
ncbi:hypothetical protein GQ457_01G000130 [Hibiscus cannabinus]